MKLASRISSIRRHAWKTLSSCSRDSAAMWRDSFASRAARRVDVLAAGLEHARDRVLRQPVDLQVGVQRAQLARDRDVAPRVAEADRRGDEQRALRSPRSRGARARPARRPAVGAGGEVVQQLVEAHRVARVGAVADVDELDELGAGRRRRRRRRGRAGSARPRRPASRAAGSCTRASRSSIVSRGPGRAPPSSAPASPASSPAPRRPSPRAAWSSAARCSSARRRTRGSRGSPAPSSGGSPWPSPRIRAARRRRNARCAPAPPA